MYVFLIMYTVFILIDAEKDLVILLYSVEFYALYSVVSICPILCLGLECFSSFQPYHVLDSYRSVQFFCWPTLQPKDVFLSVLKFRTYTNSYCL